MKIAYNPLSSGVYIPTPDYEDDIIFDLVSKVIYAKGVPFDGTKYSVFRKHTSPDNTGGSEGLVPIPSYSALNNRLLREDGQWVQIAGVSAPDDKLSTESTNSVENRVITNKINEIIRSLSLKAENVYKIIKVGTINLIAQGINDTLEFIQGDGIALIPNDTNKSITVSTKAIGEQGLDVYYSGGQLIVKVADIYYNRWNETYNWYRSITDEDTDTYINKWQEIVDFLNNVQSGTDILDEFVTRKTAQIITGYKVFSLDSDTAFVVDNQGLTNDKDYSSIFFGYKNEYMVGIGGASDKYLHRIDLNGNKFRILDEGNYKNIITTNLYWADQLIKDSPDIATIPTFGGAIINGLITLNNNSNDSNSFIITHNSSLPDDGLFSLVFGKEANSYSRAYMGYRHVGQTSSLNRIEFGLYGAASLLNILGGGNVGIGITNPIQKLQVAGAGIFNNTNSTTYATDGITIGAGDHQYRYITAYGKTGYSYINFGYSPANNNCGELYFNYSSSGSTSNYAALSLYGAANTVYVYPGYTQSTKNISAPNYISSASTGTQPYACTSTTLNTNLNADLLDDFHSTKFPLLNGIKSGTWDWNDVLRAGYYKIQAGTITNHPSGIYAYGMAAVLTTENHADGENRELQLYYPHNQTNHIAIWGRMHNSSTQGAGWGPWWGIPNTEGVKQIINTYYWANLSVQQTASSTTHPTFGHVSIKGGDDSGLNLHTSAGYTRIRFYNASNANNANIHYFGTAYSGHTFVKDSLNLDCTGLVTLGRWNNPTLVVSSNTTTSNSDGKVGIGTNNPSEKLQIAGNIKIQGTSNTSSTPDIYLGHYTSWSGGTYPTLMSGYSSKWIMHFNPHICRSTSTDMPGSNIRMESVNKHYFDVSVGHDDLDTFKIRYNNSKNVLTITNTGQINIINGIVMSGSIGAGAGSYLVGNDSTGVYLAANESGKKIFLESTNQDSPWFRNKNGDYQILHTGNYSSWALPALRMRNPSNGTSYHGSIPYILALKAAGTPLYGDPEFASGNNNCAVYNNSGNGVVTVSRISDSQGSANSSGYILQIYNSGGTSSPGRGGFYQYIQARKNAVFAQIFRAKIPTGFTVANAENHMGDGYTTYWLTDTAGTGKWEWYCRITICGSGGTMSSGGHVYLNGSGAVTWYLAYCNVIDLTKGNYDGLRTQYADSATNTTNIYVHQHTANNVEYPLVWTSQNNTSTMQSNQLHKSYNHLTYNPSAQRISVPNISLSTLNGHYKFYTTDVPEGAANLGTTTTAHTMSFYRNGISIPYQMDDSNDGGLIRVRGTSESNCIFEMATWDDYGTGETIQFNYYPTTSQVTPTYSVSVPKKSGTIALTSDIPPAKAYKWYTTIQGSTWSRLYTGNNATLHHSSIFSVTGSIGCVVFSHTFLVEANHSTNAKIIQLFGGSYTQFSIRTLVNSSGDVLVDMNWVGNDCSVGSSTQKMTVEVNAICLSGSISPTTSFVSDASIPSGYSNSCSYSTRPNCSVFMELYSHGNVYGSHFYETSDAKYKTNIQSILDYDNIPQLRQFDWKESGQKGYGLIAQELEQQGYYELVDTDDQGEKTVNYSAALSLIVGKLQVKIRELEKEIENLKNKN